MNDLDMRELSSQARIDARRLFRVSELLYKVALIINWVLGALGVIAAIVAGSHNFAAGIALIFFTLFVCGLLYIFAVLSTHVGKVLAHTSLACVANMEKSN